MPEHNMTTIVNVRLPVDLRKRLGNYLGMTGQTVSDFVRKRLADWLDENHRVPGPEILSIQERGEGMLRELNELRLLYERFDEKDAELRANFAKLFNIAVISTKNLMLKDKQIQRLVFLLNETAESQNIDDAKNVYEKPPHLFPSDLDALAARYAQASFRTYR